MSLGGHYVAMSKHWIAKNTADKGQRRDTVISTSSYKQSNNVDWVMGFLGSWETKAHRDTECSNQNTVPPDIGMQA